MGVGNNGRRCKLFNYRVSWSYDNGMSFSGRTESFTALNDGDAKIKARAITKQDEFKLEQYREVPVPK